MAKKSALILSLMFLILANSAFAQAGNLSLNPKIGESFGVQVKHILTTEEDLRLIKAAGFGYVRFDMPWKWVEISKGTYFWKNYDAFMQKLKSNDLGAVIILRGGNEIYTEMARVNPKTHWGQSQIASAPKTTEEIAAFTAFSSRAVERYKNQTVVWDIWNEPDMPFWIPKPNPEDYAKLATALCQAIRTIDDDAIVIGPSVAQLPGEGIPYRNSFIKDLLRSPALECLDAISLHPYRARDQEPESVIKDYIEVRDYMSEQLPEGAVLPPIVSSEWGYTLTRVNNSEQMQADYLLRSHLSNLLAGAPLSIWYEWRNSFEDEEGNPEGHFGILTSDHTPKKAYEEILKILPLIKDFRIEERLDVNDPHAFIISIRKDDGARGIIAWYGAKASKGTSISLSWRDKRNRDKTENIELTTSVQFIDTEKSIASIYEN